MVETSVVEVKADTLDNALRRLAKTMRQQVTRKAGDKAASSQAFFNKLQIDQLEEIQNGGTTCKELLKAFSEAVKANPTKIHRLQGRAYGGGTVCAAVTFDKLVRELVPWHRRAFASEVTVSSKGGGLLELDGTTKNALVGVAFTGTESGAAGDPGTPRYICFSIGERSAGETYYTKHGYAVDLKTELSEAFST